MSKLLLTFTLAGAAAAVYFEAGETTAQCHLDSAGNTVVHFDHVSQKSFKCTHNTARTKCTCTTHPTHHDGACKQFVHTDGTQFALKGDCTDKGLNAVDCVGTWSGYGSCSKPCAGGTQTRTYTITTPKNHLGAACPYANGATQSQACNTHVCPVNCVGSWSGYGSCSKTCGGGSQTRTYKVTTAQVGTGSACAYANGATQSQPCNTEACAATQCWTELAFGAWSGSGQGSSTHPWWPVAKAYSAANLEAAKKACYTDKRCLGVWMQAASSGRKIYTGSSIANEYMGWKNFNGPPHSPSQNYFALEKKPCNVQWTDRMHGAWSGSGQGSSTHPWMPQKIPYSPAGLAAAKAACLSDDRCLGVWADAKLTTLYTGSKIANEYFGWTEYKGPPHSPSTAYYAWKKMPGGNSQVCWTDREHGAWSGSGQGTSTHPWMPQKLPFSQKNLQLARDACAAAGPDCLGVWTDKAETYIYTGSKKANEYLGWCHATSKFCSTSLPHSPTTNYYAYHKKPKGSKDCSAQPAPTPAPVGPSCWASLTHGAWSGAGQGELTHPWMPNKLPFSQANLEKAKTACASDKRCLGVWMNAQPQWIYTGSSIAHEYIGWRNFAGPPHSPSTSYFALQRTPCDEGWTDRMHGAWSGSGQGASTHPWMPKKIPYSASGLAAAKASCLADERCLGVWADAKLTTLYTGSSLAGEYFGWTDYAGPPHSPSTNYYAWKKKKAGTKTVCWTDREHGAWSGSGQGTSSHPWMPYKLPFSQANLKIAQDACSTTSKCLGVWTDAKETSIYTGSSIASEYLGWCHSSSKHCSTSLPHSPTTNYYAYHKKNTGSSSCSSAPAPAPSTGTCWTERRHGAWSGNGQGTLSHFWMPQKLSFSIANLKKAKDACAKEVQCLGVWTDKAETSIYTGSSIVGEYLGWRDYSGPPHSPSTNYYSYEKIPCGGMCWTPKAHGAWSGSGQGDSTHPWLPKKIPFSQANLKQAKQACYSSTACLGVWTDAAEKNIYTGSSLASEYLGWRDSGSESHSPSTSYYSYQKTKCDVCWTTKFHGAWSGSGQGSNHPWMPSALKFSAMNLELAKALCASHDGCLGVWTDAAETKIYTGSKLASEYLGWCNGSVNCPNSLRHSPSTRYYAYLKKACGTLRAGKRVENTFESIKDGCPSGYEPVKCDTTAGYNKLIEFSRQQNDGEHYLGNCVLDDARSMGYYSHKSLFGGWEYVSAIGIPSGCQHCTGNGDGCNHVAFGQDPVAFRNGQTSDWGLCSTCMHHKCESLQHGKVVCEKKKPAPAPAPLPTGLFKGNKVDNTFESIKDGCPSGSKPFRCNSPGAYDALLAFSAKQNDGQHYLANCVIDDANSMGYYSGTTYKNAMSIPSTCKHCKGNGDGCNHVAYGQDPVAFKNGATSDWGLCSTCMHHKCESHQTGYAVCYADVQAPTPAPAPLPAGLFRGFKVENTFVSIKNGCPAGSEPVKCSNLQNYNELLAFSKQQNDGQHYLANCVIDDAKSMGYYSGTTYQNAMGIPSTCAHCKGNGDGCNHVEYGQDPVAFKNGATSDWGLCSTCMHHKCESLQTGYAVCKKSAPYVPPTVGQLFAGTTVENTYASIQNGCPVGSRPIKCDSQVNYDRLVAFSASKNDGKHYLANCVLDDAQSMGYYSGTSYMRAMNIPSSCTHCKGNGDGCAHQAFGQDPVAFKNGGTSDWGLCSTCMHHKCESLKTGVAVCEQIAGGPLKSGSLVKGALVENTYESIRNGCPSGSEPVKCNNIQAYNELLEFSALQSDDSHYLANCVIDDAKSMGYYSGTTYKNAMSIPTSCAHCKGNGDGCNHVAFGQDPVAFRNGQTSDWNLCTTCMHHKCESAQKGFAVCRLL